MILPLFIVFVSSEFFENDKLSNAKLENKEGAAAT